MEIGSVRGFGVGWLYGERISLSQVDEAFLAGWMRYVSMVNFASDERV